MTYLGGDRSAGHWSAWQAAACAVLLWVTGWPLARWHPWPQVRWPADMVPYAVFCVLVAAACWLVMSRWGERIPRELTWVGAAVLFALFFHYDLHRAPYLHGADNTEALQLASSALLHGHDPYNLTTHLGKAIGPLFGGILLAVPLYAATGR